MTPDDYAIEFCNSNDVPFATDSKKYRALVRAIAAAVQDEREAIRDAAQPFLNYLDAIPAWRPDDIGIVSIDKLDHGKVDSVVLTVGDFRKLAAAIRARNDAGE